MKSNELLTAYIEQSKMIAEMFRAMVSVNSNQNPLAPVVERLQGTVDKMQATLDRVVASRYDQPVTRTIHAQEDSPMLPFMSDQGDGSEDIEHGIRLAYPDINAEKDTDFLDPKAA